MMSRVQKAKRILRTRLQGSSEAGVDILTGQFLVGNSAQQAQVLGLGEQAEGLDGAQSETETFQRGQETGLLRL